MICGSGKGKKARARSVEQTPQAFVLSRRYPGPSSRESARGPPPGRAGAGQGEKVSGAVALAVKGVGRVGEVPGGDSIAVLVVDLDLAATVLRIGEEDVVDADFTVDDDKKDDK